GASACQTAVKIHPKSRRGQAVYVTDASRAVAVTSALMSRQQRPGYVADVRSEYARIAAAHARSQDDRHRLSLAAARTNALKVDWAAARPPRPDFLGVQTLDDYPLAELVDYIDWTPFFATWE